MVDFDSDWSVALTRAGYERYEVSNWALPGRRSRHNQAYWHNHSYLGIGPGAASSLHPLRWVNRANPDDYAAALLRGHSPRARTERVTPPQRLLETLATGLRTRDGIQLTELDCRFGVTWRQLLAPPLAALVAQSIIRCDRVHLHIEDTHLTRADSVVGHFARWLGQELPA
jgi:oxygen-independent coproporphyrinogen-3 oxidase